MFMLLLACLYLGQRQAAGRDHKPKETTAGLTQPYTLKDNIPGWGCGAAWTTAAVQQSIHTCPTNVAGCP